MALSVLPVNPKRSKFGIWDSEKQEFIAIGTEEKMYSEKDYLEHCKQQEQDNRQALSTFEFNIKALVAGGMTREEAEKYLQDHPLGLNI